MPYSNSADIQHRGGVILGSADLTFASIIDVIRFKLFGIESEGATNAAISIVWELRLPRVLLAFAAGGSLAVAGAAMQSVTQNVLAEPYILGVSGGASAAVAIAFVIGGSLSSSTSFVSICAFLGEYVTQTGKVRRVDDFYQVLALDSGVVAFENIRELESNGGEGVEAV